MLSVAHLRNDTPQSAALSAFVPLRIPRLVSMRPPRPGCTCGLSRPPDRTRTPVTQSEQPQLPASHPPLHLLCRDPASYPPPLPGWHSGSAIASASYGSRDRKSTRLKSSQLGNSYAVF